MSRQPPSGSAANAHTVAAFDFRLPALSVGRAVGFGEASAEPTCI